MPVRGGWQAILVRNDAGRRKLFGVAGCAPGEFRGEMGDRHPFGVTDRDAVNGHRQHVYTGQTGLDGIRRTLGAQLKCSAGSGPINIVVAADAGQPFERGWRDSSAGYSASIVSP